MARPRKNPGSTPKKDLDEKMRREMAAEVWVRFFAEERAFTETRAHILTRRFAEAHSYFSLPDLINLLSAGQTVGNMMMALRGSALGAEICSAEIDALMQIAAARHGPMFFLRYLPPMLITLAESLIRAWSEARGSIIAQARITTADPRTDAIQDRTRAQELAQNIRDAYPNQKQMGILSNRLKNEIEAALPALDDLVAKIAARELTDALREYAGRVKVGKHWAEESDLVEIEE